MDSVDSFPDTFTGCTGWFVAGRLLPAPTPPRYRCLIPSAHYRRIVSLRTCDCGLFCCGPSGCLPVYATVRLFTVLLLDMRRSFVVFLTFPIPITASHTALWGIPPTTPHTPPHPMLRYTLPLPSSSFHTAHCLTTLAFTVLLFITVQFFNSSLLHTHLVTLASTVFWLPRLPLYHYHPTPPPAACAQLCTPYQDWWFTTTLVLLFWTYARSRHSFRY